MVAKSAALQGNILRFAAVLPPKPSRSAVRRIKLTEQRIAALGTESTVAQYIYDTLVPSLAVRSTRTGIKTFVVVKKIHGRTQRITLGRFPALRLDDARQAAQGVAGDLAQGRDPIAQRKALRIRKTRLEEIWPKYLLHLKSRNRTWARDEERWKTHVAPAFGKKAARDITRADCQALVDRIGVRHKIAANRIASFLSSLFGFAADDVPVNPAKKLRRYPENSRSRILKSEELPMLLSAIEAETQPWPDVFKMLLYTGARRGAVAKMRWHDVDLGSGIWTIPPESAKNKTATSIPLTSPATKLLGRRLQIRAGEPWVFPSAVGNGPIVGLPKAWARILKRANLSNLRIHDIRRSVGTALARGGASPHIIATGLGHRSIASAKSYVRLAGEDARQALGDAISSLTNR